MRIVIALAIALMAANHVSLVQADERSETGDKVYEYVMERATFYASINRSKVMAACIDWDSPNEWGIYLHNVFTTYTSPNSDIPIFTGELARDAKHRCKQWAKSENIDCTCQRLDSNGKNVLKVPARK